MAGRRWMLPAMGRRAALAFAALAVLSGMLTYLVMTGAAPLIPATAPNVIVLLSVDLVLLLLLAVVVGQRVLALWMQRRRRRIGSQLQARLTVLFTLVALLPTLMVALFTVLFFHYGLQGWFSERVQTAVDQSLAVAEAYVHEHQRLLVSDALAMASDLGRGGVLLFADTQGLQNVLEGHARLRSLSDAQVMEADGQVLARSMLSLGATFSPAPEWALDAARNGEVAVVSDPQGDRLGALLRIPALDETFLHIGRFVDPVVVNQLTRVRSAADEYASFEGRRSHIEVTFAMMFATVALLFLLAAMWVGFSLAAQLAEPIRQLISAADRVRGGDLTARVVVDQDEHDELGALAQAFNRMTGQLSEQRAELIGANLELEDRRRFTETVLAGVAVGVVGLDAGRRLHLPNRAASDLLGLDLEAHTGEPFAALVPSFAPGLEEAARRPERPVEIETALESEDGARTFQLRITAQLSDAEVEGFVLTFADITELRAAERQAAWSDVARRIAHEIKNPLTPIRLAAERLGRRYRKQIVDDPDTFTLCIETIVRQVEDLRRMVNEFSSFSRMPAPAPARVDLAEAVQRAVFLHAEAAPGLRLETRLPDGPVWHVCDPRQIGQALTNLLRNALQALDGKAGHVLVSLAEDEERIEIAVEDDGPGFPRELRGQLTEPYVTTKGRRGAGLGLAIVRKIVEDHDGALYLEDAARGGARARIVLPRAEHPARPA